ncbi:hypothetical protein GCM10023192_60410 [Amycolatopsis samaneae]
MLSFYARACNGSKGPLLRSGGSKGPPLPYRPWLVRPNVAFGASNAPNATLGASNAPNATLGRSARPETAEPVVRCGAVSPTGPR